MLAFQLQYIASILRSAYYLYMKNHLNKRDKKSNVYLYVSEKCFVSPRLTKEKALVNMREKRIN